MIGFLQSTKAKMLIAQFIYRVFHFMGIRDHQIVNRQGIFYELNLKEGIDFSLFLLGNFQKHIYENIIKNLPENPIIIDVGANIGAMSLNLAKKLPDAHIYAFEPTYYAWNKLLRNLTLNPDLKARITPIQSFLGEQTTDNSDLVAYSSWPINSLKTTENKHSVHLGEAKESIENETSIDDFIKTKKLEKVDLIKIDTDGHELEVLKGSVATLKEHRPIVIFEFGDYLLAERGTSQEEYFNLFNKLQYILLDSKTHTALSIDNIKRFIPQKGTIDIIAFPQKY